MKPWAYSIFLLSLFGLFQNEALGIGFEDATYPELVTSARALGMGNAYISRVDDQSSAFYNPAGFGSIRYPHIHLSNMHIETNRGHLSSATGGKGTDLFGNFPKAFSLDGARELLLDNRGKIHNSRLQFMPNFTTRFFSMGYMYSKTTRSTIGLEENAPFEYAKRTDHGPYTSLNISFMGGIFKVGTTAVWLSRKEAIGQALAEESFELEDEDHNAGQSFIFISGAKLTLPVQFLPTLSVKANNTFKQKFRRRTDYPTAPEAITNSIDLGFSLTPKINNLSWVHLEFNYKDITDEYEGISTSRKMSLGMELDIARSFFFRLGYADGFGSFGMGFKKQEMQFDLTTYAVDTTANEFRGKEDRRFVLSFSSGI